MTSSINDEYLKYWKILDEDSSGKPNTVIYKDNHNYKNNRKYFIDDKKGYPTYIKDIKLDNLPDLSNIGNANQFIYVFLEQLFINISVKPYLKQKSKIININRPNHGSLNHFRSFLFSAYVINIFITTKLELFKKYITKNKIELIFLLLSSYFQSFLRVDEDKNEVQFFNTKTNNTNFEKIFIEISKDNDIKEYFTDGRMNIYMTTLASSFLFMSICKYLKSTNETIHNNLTDEFIEKIGLGLCMFEQNEKTLNNSNDNLKSIFLFYGIISFGHYSDHCREIYSHILEETHIKFLLGNIDIVKKNNNHNLYINILKYIILLLSLTEWNNDSINFISLKNKINEFWSKLTQDISQNICKHFLNNRYENPNFQTYSKNFNSMYNGIKTELNDFINFEDNINYDITLINDEEANKKAEEAKKAEDEAKKKASSKKKNCSMKSLLNLSGGYYKINRGKQITKKNVLKINKFNKINKKTKTQKYKN